MVVKSFDMGFSAPYPHGQVSRLPQAKQCFCTLTREPHEHVSVTQAVHASRYLEVGRVSGIGASL